MLWKFRGSFVNYKAADLDIVGFALSPCRDWLPRLSPSVCRSHLLCVIRRLSHLCVVTTCVVCDVIGSRLLRWSMDFDGSGWTDVVFLAFVGCRLRIEWSAFDDGINIKLNSVFCIIVLHYVSSKFYTLELLTHAEIDSLLVFRVGQLINCRI